MWISRHKIIYFMILALNRCWPLIPSYIHPIQSNVTMYYHGSAMCQVFPQNLKKFHTGNWTWQGKYIQFACFGGAETETRYLDMRNSQRWARSNFWTEVENFFNLFLCGKFSDLTIRVSHLQFFWIFILFQAGMNARHTKEQKNIGLLCFTFITSS